jgi:hypothetical protein
MHFSTLFKTFAIAASLATMVLALPISEGGLAKRQIDIEIVRRTDELVELYVVLYFDLYGLRLMILYSLGRGPSINEIVDATMVARGLSTPNFSSLERRLDPPSGMYSRFIDGALF